MVVRCYRHRFGAVEFAVIEKPQLVDQTHFKTFRTGKLLLGYFLIELRRLL